MMTVKERAELANNLESRPFWASPLELGQMCVEAAKALRDQETDVAHAADVLMRACHGAAVSAGWWTDLNTGESLIGKRNVGEMLMLAVSEIAEAMEGHRKGLNDDKLVGRPMMEVEIADCIIRLCDTAGAMGFDLGGALAQKMTFNASRADHKPENRRAAGGKQY